MTCINMLSLRLDNFRLNFAAAIRVCTALNLTQQHFVMNSNEYRRWPNYRWALKLLSSGMIIVASAPGMMIQLIVPQQTLRANPPKSLIMTLTMVCVCVCVCVCVTGTGGVSKLYESQERAVLHEYHDVLLKLVDRASQKQKDAQQPSISRPSREAPASSRPLSAPANMTDAPQQHMNGGVTQGDFGSDMAHAMHGAFLACDTL